MLLITVMRRLLLKVVLFLTDKVTPWGREGVLPFVTRRNHGNKGEGVVSLMFDIKSETAKRHVSVLLYCNNFTSLR